MKPNKTKWDKLREARELEIQKGPHWALLTEWHGRQSWAYYGDFQSLKADYFNCGMCSHYIVRLESRSGARLSEAQGQELRKEYETGLNHWSRKV